MTRAMTDSELTDFIESLSFDLDDAKKRIGQLEQIVSAYGEILDPLRNRVYALEHDTPQARRLQRELDETLADNAAAGYSDEEPQP